MSTLNLALQNMDKEAESIVKEKNMAEVRESVERHPSLGKQLQESLSHLNGAPDIWTVFEQPYHIDPS